MKPSKPERQPLLLILRGPVLTVTALTSLFLPPILHHLTTTITLTQCLVSISLLAIGLHLSVRDVHERYGRHYQQLATVVAKGCDDLVLDDVFRAIFRTLRDNTAAVGSFTSLYACDFLTKEERAALIRPCHPDAWRIMSEAGGIWMLLPTGVQTFLRGATGEGATDVTETAAEGVLQRRWERDLDWAVEDDGTTVTTEGGSWSAGGCNGGDGTVAVSPRDGTPTPTGNTTTDTSLSEIGGAATTSSSSSPSSSPMPRPATTTTCRTADDDDVGAIAFAILCARAGKVFSRVDATQVRIVGAAALISLLTQWRCSRTARWIVKVCCHGVTTVGLMATIVGSAGVLTARKRLRAREEEEEDENLLRERGCSEVGSADGSARSWMSLFVRILTKRNHRLRNGILFLVLLCLGRARYKQLKFRKA